MQASDISSFICKMRTTDHVSTTAWFLKPSVKWPAYHWERLQWRPPMTMEPRAVFMHCLAPSADVALPQILLVCCVYCRAPARREWNLSRRYFEMTSGSDFQPVEWLVSNRKLVLKCRVAAWDEATTAWGWAVLLPLPVTSLIFCPMLVCAFPKKDIWLLPRRLECLFNIAQIDSLFTDIDSLRRHRCRFDFLLVRWARNTENTEAINLATLEMTPIWHVLLLFTPVHGFAFHHWGRR